MGICRARLTNCPGALTNVRMLCDCESYRYPPTPIVKCEFVTPRVKMTKSVEKNHKCMPLSLRWIMFLDIPENSSPTPRQPTCYRGKKCIGIFQDGRHRGYPETKKVCKFSCIQ